MNGVTLNGFNLVILEGTSKEGKPYCFAKLDKNLGNNPAFIKQAREAGAIIIKDGKVSR